MADKSTKKLILISDEFFHDIQTLVEKLVPDISRAAKDPKVLPYIPIFKTYKLHEGSKLTMWLQNGNLSYNVPRKYENRFDFRTIPDLMEPLKIFSNEHAC